MHKEVPGSLFFLCSSFYDCTACENIGQADGENHGEMVIISTEITNYQNWPAQNGSFRLRAKTSFTPSIPFCCFTQISVEIMWYYSITTMLYSALYITYTIVQSTLLDYSTPRGVVYASFQSTCLTLKNNNPSLELSLLRPTEMTWILFFFCWSFFKRCALISSCTFIDGRLHCATYCTNNYSSLVSTDGAYDSNNTIHFSFSKSFGLSRPCWAKTVSYPYMPCKRCTLKHNEQIPLEL